MSNNVNVIVSGPNNNATSQYKTLILKSAKTFKELVTLPNTKYVIRYDFDLNGETITIPTGSILEFDGGMVSNGTLVGLNTKILNLTNTDSLDVTLEGTFEEIGLINKDDLLLKKSQTLTTLEKDTVVENILSKNSTNGMGRVILKENIIDGINTLTLSMMTLNNTIYVIQYDFTLGENITIPENCVMEFDGGSISGEHTITGNNTGIDARLIKIFNTDVTLAGSWNVVEAYPEWFGANSDFSTDSRAAIQKTIDSFKTIVFTQTSYYIKSGILYNGALRGIVIPAFKTLIGKALNDHYTALRFWSDVESGLYIDYGHINIEGVEVYGSQYDNSQPVFEDSITRHANNGIDSNVSVSHVFLHRVSAWFCKADGIHLNSWRTTLEDCKSVGNLGYGFYVGHNNGGTSLFMSGCYSLKNRKSGYRIYWLGYSSMLSCACDGCGYDQEWAHDEADINTLYYAYEFENCNTFTSISCGSEGCYYALRLLGSILNSSFIDNRFWLKGDNLPESFDGKYIVRLSAFCKNVTFSRWNINDNVGGMDNYFPACNFIVVNNAVDVIFDHVSFSTSSGQTYVKNDSINGITLDTKVYPLSKLTKTISSITSLDNLINLDNTLSLSSSTIISSDIKLRSFSKAVEYVGNNNDIKITEGSLYIENVDNITFKGFYTIRFYDKSAGEQTPAIIIKDSVVTFKSLYLRVGDITTRTCIKLENSILKLENCSFLFNSSSTPYNIIFEKDDLSKILVSGYNGIDTETGYWEIEDTNKIMTLYTGVTGAGIGCKGAIVHKGIEKTIMGINQSGVFDDKPDANDIYVGFRYFCTDKQTTEGATDGIEIIHKGNNVWVDALGRVVS